MQQNQETQQNALTGNKKNANALEESQANTGSAVREGQEDSSILHDQPDDMAEMGGPLNRDISSTSQEEYVDNDNNTLKDKE